MDFSGLVKGVQDFWNFIWPPVICILLLFGVVAVVAPASLERLSVFARIWSRPSDPSRRVAWFKTVKRYGFDKLIPILAAFALVFLLDVARSAVLFLGGAVPPNISYDSDRLLLTHSTSTDLRGLWFKAGSPRELAEFRGRIERAVGEADDTHKNSALLESIHFWGEKQSREYAAFNACKFLVIWSALCVIFGRATGGRAGRRFFRGSVAMLVFAGFAVVFCIRFVYAVEQKFYAQTQAANVLMTGAVPDCNVGNACDDYYRFLDASVAVRAHPHRWWFVSEADFRYYLRWLREQAVNQFE